MSIARRFSLPNEAERQGWQAASAGASALITKEPPFKTDLMPGICARVAQTYSRTRAGWHAHMPLDDPQIVDTCKNSPLLELALRHRKAKHEIYLLNKADMRMLCRATRGLCISSRGPGKKTVASLCSEPNRAIETPFLARSARRLIFSRATCQNRRRKLPVSSKKPGPDLLAGGKFLTRHHIKGQCSLIE